MEMTLFIDIGLAVGLLLFLLRGVKRGLLLSLAGLVIWIVAMVGAFFLSGKLAPPAAEALRPVLETSIATQMEKTLTDAITPELPSQLELPNQMDLPEWTELLPTVEQADQILEALGMAEATRTRLIQQVEEAVQETGKSIASAVMDSLLQYVTRGVLFFVLFVALTVLLHIVVKSLNLVLELPVLHQLNAAGGGLLGLLEGALLVLVLLFVLDRLGIRFSPETVASTRLLPYFVPSGPIAMFFYF